MNLVGPPCGVRYRAPYGAYNQQQLQNVSNEIQTYQGFVSSWPWYFDHVTSRAFFCSLEVGRGVQFSSWQNHLVSNLSKVFCLPQAWLWRRWPLKECLVVLLKTSVQTVMCTSGGSKRERSLWDAAGARSSSTAARIARGSTGRNPTDSTASISPSWRRSTTHSRTWILTFSSCHQWREIQVTLWRGWSGWCRGFW